MKRLRRITAVILAMVMVLSTMTNVFAAKYEYKNIGFSTRVKNLTTGKYGEIKSFTLVKVSNDNGKKWDEVTPQFDLSNGWYVSGNNKIDISENTQFYIEAVMDDKVNTEVVANIVNKPNYKNGKSYYRFNSNNKKEIRLSSVEVVEKVYSVSYVSEEGVNNLPEGTEGLKKGAVYTIPSTEPTKEGYTFSGWSDGVATYKLGDKVDVTKDITLKAVWKENLYTVTYKVNGEPVKTINDVKHGALVPAYEYEPKVGENFSGWLNKPKTVTENLVIEGKTSLKEFTVKFVNGDKVDSKTYEYGSFVEVPQNPTKEDEITNDSTGAAKWSKFTFKGWEAKGNYNVTDEVTQDMTFEATYTKKNVDVYFFVLNRGTAQKEEPGSYSSSDYSKGVKGTLKSFEAVNNNDERVKELICDAPEAADFGIELKEGESIKWYVIKPINNGEKWHVDGIIVGQTYNVTVECIDAKTDEVIETKTISVVATEDYSINLPEIEGYELVDKDTTVSGIMPYKNVKETVKYQKKTYTVTYKVDGEEYETFTVEYGKEIPASTYEVPEGYDFTGFKVVTGEEDATVVKQDMVFEGTATIKTFTVTYKVDGEEYETFTVEYGKEIPTSTYEVAEGYEFSGFELVTEVEDATVVKQNMVFEGTTNEIVVEEEEDIELDTPFAPGTGANDNNDVDEEEEEDITLDTPFASGTKGTANNNDVDADEEEDIDLATPFSSGVKTGDASNYTAYVAVLLIAAVGAMVVAYNKKKALN